MERRDEHLAASYSFQLAPANSPFQAYLSPYIKRCEERRGLNELRTLAPPLALRPLTRLACFDATARAATTTKMAKGSHNRATDKVSSFSCPSYRSAA